MKNMKLTHLSLSVLIALGLVACGGSDNKDDMTIDKDKHGETGGKGGNGGGKPEVTPEHTGNLPQRYVPGLNVPDDLKGQVAARKRFVVRRGFTDLALGYVSNAFIYDDEASTKPEDIKRKSLYNYVEENDLVAVSGDGKNATGGFKPTAKGAISIGIPKNYATTFGTEDHLINAWVKGTDGQYYRLVPDGSYNDYSATTEFKPVDTAAVTSGFVKGKVKQKDVVFIANAKLDKNLKAIRLGADGVYILGEKDKQKEVILDNVSAFGNTYNVEKLSQNIDLSQFPVDKTKIQVEDIKAAYRVINTKGSAESDDDKVLRREATLGKFKVYNLPHSIAFVTTNADMSSEKNVFNLDGNGDSKFQLNGFQTTSLPKDGRATYTGKSFSATVEGDIELFADFFENEAGISGRVYNRKEKKGDKVESQPDLTLELITLSDPQSHATGNDKYDLNVKGDSDYADNWTVQLYGADAQEAGGFLRKIKDPGTRTATDEIKEVYTSQRGKLYPRSNDNTTK